MLGATVVHPTNVDHPDEVEVDPTTQRTTVIPNVAEVVVVAKIPRVVQVVSMGDGAEMKLEKGRQALAVRRH